MKFLPLLILPLLFTGCLSPKPSTQPAYYQLRPATEFSQSEVELPVTFLMVGPVDISPYLDQPRIAVREGENRIRYLDNSRWAEPLGTNLSNVLADNLQVYFQSNNISPVAPRLLVKKEGARLIAIINRMDVDDQGNAVLETQWATLISGSSENATAFTGHYQSNVEGEGIEAGITALNDLLNEWSLEIAQSIEGLK